ncbi:MAG: small subunit ribosomal protein S20 [Candidatus Deianiraeaceae bacterium]|jgi:small subunit ribosomal protein S20
MANKASSKKDIRQSEKSRIANKSRRTFVRTCIKKVEETIIEGNKDNAFTALKVFEKQGMKAVSKGVFRQKTISRKISRLYSRVKKIAS